VARSQHTRDVVPDHNACDARRLRARTAGGPCPTPPIWRRCCRAVEDHHAVVAVAVPTYTLPRSPVTGQGLDPRQCPPDDSTERAAEALGRRAPAQTPLASHRGTRPDLQQGLPSGCYFLDTPVVMRADPRTCLRNRRSQPCVPCGRPRSWPAFGCSAGTNDVAQARTYVALPVSGTR